jgi:GAF domain-containing protein
LMAHQPTDVTFALAELGRMKLDEVDLKGVLDRVAELARTTLPGAGQASISLIREDGVYTAACTGEVAARLDELQHAGLSGPGLEAASGRGSLVVPDTTADDRWNGWPRRAAEAGVGSVLAVGLPILETVEGALTVYGDRPHAFDEKTVRLARTFAECAGTALANAHLYATKVNLTRQMQAAMASRAVIEQAKGILMAERRCSAEEAFAVLIRASQDSNRKLRDVALALVGRTQRGPAD